MPGLGDLFRAAEAAHGHLERLGLTVLAQRDRQPGATVAGAVVHDHLAPGALHQVGEAVPVEVGLGTPRHGDREVPGAGALGGCQLDPERERACDVRGAAETEE